MFAQLCEYSKKTIELYLEMGGLYRSELFLNRTVILKRGNNNNIAVCTGHCHDAQEPQVTDAGISR
jgi:hypothetical protein